MRSIHFGSDHTNPICYYIYQPLCLLVEPFVVQNKIIPNDITVTRMFASVAAGAAIVACAVDADNSRRWLWLFCVYILVLYIDVSDIVDGYIARKYNLQSAWGSKIDGFADMASWVITWTAMLYAFGLTNIWKIVLFWLIALGAVLITNVITNIIPKKNNKSGLAGFQLANLLPLLVTTIFVAFPACIAQPFSCVKNYPQF